MELVLGKHKHTDIGIIPIDWEVKRIEEIANVKSGKRLPLGKSLSTEETMHPYIRVTDMYQGGVSLKEIKYVPEIVFPSIKNYRIFNDDIFISVAGTLGIIGKIPDELDGANLTENADRLTNITCDRDFLLYILSSSLIQNTIEAERTLGAQPKLALIRIRNFQIPLPPTKSEQIEIANTLRHADYYIYSLEKLIAKKLLIKHGAIQQFFSNINEWELKRLGEECEVITKGTTPTSVGREFQQDGINFIKIESLTDYGGIIAEKVAFIDTYTHILLKRSQLKTGDILFSIAGALGRVAIVDEEILPANTNQALAIIRLRRESNINLKYLFYYLNSTKIKTHILEISVQGAQANLSLLNINELPIKFPDITTQIHFANILEDMDEEILVMEKKLNKAKQIKKGMMQQLLTGKIRLQKS